MKKKIFLFLSFFFIVSFLNFGLWNVFFQQDEWYWFGRALIIQQNGIGALFQVAGFHFNPLYTLLVYLFYTIFSIHWQFYAIFSLIMQTINAYLLFILVRNIYKKQSIAFLSALFFVFANVSQQAVTWYAASFGVLPAATFGLLSMIFFHSYYKSHKKKLLFLSYLFIFIGLGFKEDIMSLFLIYGIIFLYFKKIKNRSASLFILFLGAMYFLVRGIIQKLDLQNPLTHINMVMYIESVFKNAVFIPLQSLSQLYFSPLMVYNLGHLITNGHEEFFLLFSPINNIDIFIETVFFNIVTVSLTAFFLIFFGILLLKSKYLRKNVSGILVLLFTIICFSPLFLLPHGFGMESRHYYFPSVGGSVLFALVVSALVKIFRKQYNYFIVAGVILYFGYNFLLDRQQLDMVIGLSRPRIVFVQQLKKVFPNIPPNSVFFSEADVIPFQSGMGQMLMVLFSNKTNKYQFNSLLSSNVLWDMGSQGYEKKNNEVFGYFSDRALFEQACKNYYIALNNVYAFSWNNKKMSLKNISPSIRKELQSNE